MKIFLTTLMLLFTVNAHALGVSQISVTSTGITFTYRDGLVEVINFAGMGVATVNEANAQVLQDYIQGKLDVVVKRSDLAVGDPQRQNDPARAGAFWSAQNTITYRNTLVDVFIENGLFNVEFRSVDVND